MIELARNVIENITVQLTVEETVGSQLGGYPTLLIGDVNIESVMVQEVDTLAVIKAIVTSETATDFEYKIKGCWRANKMATILKSFIALNDEIDPNFMVENTISNGVWLEELHKADDIFCDEDSTPWERTKAMARIYDCRRHLTFVPVPKEIKEMLSDE